MTEFNPGGAASLDEAIALRVDTALGGQGWRKGLQSGAYNASTGVVTLTLSDNSTVTTGDLRGAQGPAGSQGPIGPEGPQGPAGADGADGSGAIQPNGTAAQSISGGIFYATEANLAQAITDNPNAVIIKVSADGTGLSITMPGAASEAVFGGSTSPISPATGYIVTTTDGTVSNYDDDGTNVTFTISGSSITAHNGDYSVPKADLDAGLPVWLVDPVPTSDGMSPPTFTANAQTGLQIYPTADPSSVVVGWIVDNNEVATGPTYTRQALQEDAEIIAQYRAENVATTVPVAANVVAQAPVIWPSNVVSFQQSKLTRDMSAIATPTVQKFAFVVWGTQPIAPSSDYLLTTDIDGVLTASNYDTHVQEFGGAYKFFISQLDGAAARTRLQVNAPTFSLATGDRYCAVFTGEIGGVARQWLSKNGGQFVAGATVTMNATGSIPVNFKELALYGSCNGNFNYIDINRSRTALYVPQVIPDFRTAAVHYEMVDGYGRRKDEARANAVFSTDPANPITPLIDDRFDAESVRSGLHAGSIGAMTLFNATGYDVEDVV